MTRVVLDTNIIVASLWRAKSKSAAIVRDAINRKIIACYDNGIAEEYSKVLHRFKFRFPLSAIDGLLLGVMDGGLSVVAPKSTIPFTHESDRMFYDVAVHCGAILVTSNLRHYPEDDSRIMTPGAYASFAQREQIHKANGDSI